MQLSSANHMVTPIPQRLGSLVTRRARSLFQDDIDANIDRLEELLDRSRVLVVGGAGSIGSETTKLLARFNLAALHIVDHCENYLADLIRDLRSDYATPVANDIRALPIDYTGTQMRRFLLNAEPYDFVLNFAALKHVRSEKDFYSLMQMLDTNIVGHARFKSWLKKPFSNGRYFAVSTDKASNPTSLMGASKRIMEDVAFDCSRLLFDSCTSARFANVAFSNGSLPLSFLARMAKLQPLAVPKDTRRYFISLEEAGQICLLAGFLLPGRHVALPKLAPEEHLIPLQDVAAIVLNEFGFTPKFFDDESEAKSAFCSLHNQKMWPVLLTPLDTAGEKPYEEFLAENETATNVNFQSVVATAHLENAEIEMIVEQIALVVEDAKAQETVDSIVRLFNRHLRSFRHASSDKLLDDRM